MSFFSKIGSVFKAVAAPIAAVVASKVPVIGGILSSAIMAPRPAPTPGAGFQFPQIGAPPGGLRMAGPAARFGLPAAARAVGFGAGVAVRSARSVFNAASSYCRKHPQWCATIGGVAAVEALIQDGTLPIPKRHRGRGLTPKDLRSFRRVAKLIRGYCPTVRRVPSGKLKRCD